MKTAAEKIAGPLQPVPWAMPVKAVLELQASDLENGLSEEEAGSRLSRSGLNALQEEKPIPGYVRFLQQFKSPVVLTLLAATVLSAFLGETLDAVAILSIVLINALVGYLQEAKAEQAISTLKKLAAPKCRVVRAGRIREILSEETAPGDILVVEAGDYVSADARVMISNQLHADEAILTGESLPVAKAVGIQPEQLPVADRINMLFAGTVITSGSGRAAVTATGMRTEIGKIAGMMRAAQAEPTPLQLRLEEASKKLLLLCAIVVVAVAFLGLIHGEKWLEVLMSAISLAVAAIPEGLPAVVTLSLALAIRRMVKRNAIVRHLPAVETLGSTDVICTDKTGTLTTGKMRVREVLLDSRLFEASDQGIKAEPRFDDLIRASVLCSNADLHDDHGTGDPTEVALLYLARAQGAAPADIRRKFRRLAEWPFDSNLKRMLVAVTDGTRSFAYLKGAPEAVLPLCRLSEGEKKAVNAHVQFLSQQGRRTLALAGKQIGVSHSGELSSGFSREEAETDLDFIGVAAIADPPRPETISAINDCKSAGIKIVMITGDHPATAGGSQGSSESWNPGSLTAF